MSNGAQYIYTISIGLETRWIRVQLLGVSCICAYTYFYLLTHDFGHVDLCANFFPMILKSFQNFYGSYYCYTFDF